MIHLIIPYLNKLINNGSIRIKKSFPFEEAFYHMLFKNVGEQESFFGCKPS